MILWRGCSRRVVERTACWPPLPEGRQRTLTSAACAQARKVLDSRGRTGLDPETLRAVRDGAALGDRLPPLQRTPFIRGVREDADVIITGTGSSKAVAILFSHEDFPGIRFGHQFSTRTDQHALIRLMEEIETGALHRMMRDKPRADAAGIIWTNCGRSST